MQDSLSLSVVETGSGLMHLPYLVLSQVPVPKPFSIKLTYFYNRPTNQNHRRTAWISLNGLDWQTLVTEGAAQERSLYTGPLIILTA